MNFANETKTCFFSSIAMGPDSLQSDAAICCYRHTIGNGDIDSDGVIHASRANGDSPRYPNRLLY